MGRPKRRDRDPGAFLAEAAGQLIGDIPAVLDLTPRQVRAHLMLKKRRDAARLAQDALAASGDEKAIKKRIRELER